MSSPQQQHVALQNHLVISNISKYLKFKELKSFRLVSRSWESGSRTHFQSKSCVIFKNEDGRTRIRKFLKENISTFVNFKFIDLNFRTKFKKIFEFFIEQLGGVVREAAFVKCVIGDYYGEILNGLENLVVLSLTVPTYFDEEEEEDSNNNNNNDYKEGHTSVVKNNAKLKFLEITGSFSEESGKFCWGAFLEAFQNVEIFGGQCRTSEDLTRLLSILAINPCPLKKLTDFSCVLTDLHNSHLEMLLNTDSKLVNLDLSLAEEVDPSLLTKLLGNYAATLKSIKLFRDSEKPFALFTPLDISFIFISLQTLELQCNMIESLNFLQFTPHLKNLSLAQFGDGDVTFHNSLIRNTDPKLVFKPLSSFSFEYFLAPEYMRRVMGLFPNLKRLSVYLTDEAARPVFLDGVHLEELIVLGTQLSDEGITGVPLNLLERKYRFMQDYRKLPYIGNLKKLWRFVLYPQPQEKITDFSVHYGFMDLKNLSCLDIPETAISDEGIEKLQKKPNLVTLISPFYTPDCAMYSRPTELQSLL